MVEQIGILQLEGRNVDLTQCEDQSMRMIPFTVGEREDFHKYLSDTGNKISFYKPVRIYVGDQSLPSNTFFRIDDGKVQAALAIFQPDVVVFTETPEVVVCLTVRYFDHEMNAYVLVRKMMKRDQNYGGLISGYIEGQSIQLLPSPQPALVGHD